MHIRRVAEYPRPDHVLFHFSDTHLIAGDGGLYGTVDAEHRLRELLAQAEASRITPTAIVFTGDLTDHGESDAYGKLRRLVEPFAARLGAPVVWVAGNHDDRATLREHLLDEDGSAAPFDRVHLFDGLRIVVLDTTVPGHHYGELSDDQLAWLRTELAEPAPFGTILAMHHPPVPCIQDLAVTVELRDQRRLADVLDGTDVRGILAGHLHFSTTATFAGIPVSVASSSCYSQDLAVSVGGQRGRDGAQSFNYVHVYPDTVVHSVVPIGHGPTVGTPASPEEAAERLTAAGIVIPGASRIPQVLREGVDAPESDEIH
ncbi:phosphodiesterase [Nocardia terpenica]|uniref:phosphodiesterase n=1 Tax=Nocardia terpenica TaxID=455432 RepID=UPI0009EE3CD2|nr:phosphodiesterase [Nocardia terpenica]MBF6060610.1 phosphodiesterase [Nocardia terpenica]MBF6103870.1 phosphodiesterase [Nocardia terpenica]MBF6111756.1 phosphodiesterase [Nocardia terpenica]MBF6118091.1 phosphodiesterase [Nocardia terpenica]MBF6155183.1 phosphodiesterase [Nocardia terpenica]